MRARLDEVRHARVAWRLARRFGAKPVRLTPPRRRSHSRSLLDLAIENVQEGCIRETFGALAATYQAHVSTDSEVREALATIARDEAEHAALAWRIHAFCDASLDAAGRASVTAAMREGFAQLRAEIEAASGTPRDLEKVAGVPPRGVALEALCSLEQLTASM